MDPVAFVPGLAATVSAKGSRRLGQRCRGAMTGLAVLGVAALAAWSADANAAARAWQASAAVIADERDGAVRLARQLDQQLIAEREEHLRNVRLAAITARRDDAAEDRLAQAETTLRQAEARLADLAGQNAQLVDGQVQLQLLLAANAQAARRALSCVLADPASAPTRCSADLAAASTASSAP